MPHSQREVGKAQKRLAGAGSRLCAFYKLPRRDGFGESYLSTEEASLGYMMSQGQPGLHSETLSQTNKHLTQLGPHGSMGGGALFRLK